MTADDLNAALPWSTDTWIVDYRPHHVIAAGFGDIEIQKVQATLGPAFTLIHAGRVAALWGLVIPWSGLAEGWLVVDPAALRPVALRFTRNSRRFLDLAHEALALRRIQVHVQIANGVFHRWAMAGGFTEEARLPCYAPDGGDAILMARIWR